MNLFYLRKKLFSTLQTKIASKRLKCYETYGCLFNALSINDYIRRSFILAKTIQNGRIFDAIFSCTAVSSNCFFKQCSGSNDDML